MSDFDFVGRSVELREALFAEFIRFLNEKWQCDAEQVDAVNKKYQAGYIAGWNSAIKSLEGAAEAYIESDDSGC